jgi:hypothetical protein
MGIPGTIDKFIWDKSYTRIWHSSKHCCWCNW